MRLSTVIELKSFVFTRVNASRIKKCLVLLLLLFPFCAYPASTVFKCRDSKGQMLFSDRMTACAKPPASASASDSAAPLESSPTPAIVETKKPTSPAKPDNSVSQTAASPAEEAAIAAAEAAEADPSPPADSDSFAYPNSANLGGKGKAGVALLVIGGIVSLVYAVILLIKAFEVSVWWGLGSFFVPFVQLIFVILHWELTQKPFLRSLLAIPIMLAGGLLLMFSLK